MGHLLCHGLFPRVTTVRIQVLTNCKPLDQSRNSPQRKAEAEFNFGNRMRFCGWILAFRSLLHLGPGILQRHCAIEYERSRLGIGVNRKVSQALELVTITRCSAK